jgi:amino acid adenylation domain-containing protein
MMSMERHTKRGLPDEPNASPDGRDGESRQFVLSRSKLEAAVAGIWADVLAKDEVSIKDDFFRLGGDSLRAVQAAARIESELGLDLPVHEIFESRTVEQVAARLAEASQTRAPIERAARSESMALSWAQERLWFIDQLEGPNAAYNIRFAIRLHGSLNREALKSASDAILTRHESLRTRFAEINGEPVQTINPPRPLAVRVVELQHLDEALREQSLRTVLDEEVAKTFDLQAGEPIRGCLVRLQTQEHVLLLVMHHVVSDGWSLGVLARELGALYEAFCSGRTDPLPPLPIQYADYACWQRQWLKGEELRRQLEYWKEHLRGAPEFLELPTDRPRPTTRTYRGSTVDVSIGPGLTRELRTLSMQHELTLSMVLQAAWSVVLCILAGQRDLVLGIPVANRRRTELEGLIGFFVNSLAVRLQLDGSPTVNELLRRIKCVMVGAYAHQDVPFEKVVEELRPARNLSHSPLFQVMFALQNTPREQMHLSALTLADQAVPLRTTQFELFLSLYEVGDQVSGILNYNTDLFDQSTAERWASYFLVALREIVRNSQTRLDAIDLMGPIERHAVLWRFNSTETQCAPNKLVHELFEERAGRCKDVPAVMYLYTALTFGELNNRANKLARYLRARGVGADQRVGLFFERGLEAIVALLGILKAGGAYIPFDPRSPADRLGRMVRNAATRLVLTQEDLLGRIPRETEAIALDSNWEEIGSLSGTDLDGKWVGLTARNLAYAIYTSGSTGEPKGVMVEHQGVLNLWMALEPIFATMERCKRVSVNAPLYFDSSVKLLLQLVSGRTLVIVPEQIRADASALIEFASTRVDLLDCTPSHLSSLISNGLGKSNQRIPEAIVIGGEAISPEIWASASALTGTRMFNSYGPTECSVVASLCEIRGTIPTIGNPIGNVRVYILGEDLQPVPIGVRGELYIGGAGVGRGYLHLPQLTAERFVCDPFSESPSARMYRTGDVARWRADGKIEFLGRNDFQVKVRGYRIEPGEIEAQLLRSKLVKEAVVIAGADASGERQLVAYVTHFPSHVPTADELRTALRSVLPDYMVPSAYVALKNFPLTRNGKLDRHALPAPGLAARTSRRYTPPAGDIECALEKIWSELLNVERVGRYDTFFELGGHSLLATRLVSRVREKLIVELPVRSIFDAPTIATLADRIREEAAALRTQESDWLNYAKQGFRRDIEGMDEQVVAMRIAELEKQLSVQQ